jgi:hypothetical protein
MLDYKQIGRGTAAVLLAAGCATAAQGAVIVNYDFDGTGSGTKNAASNQPTVTVGTFDSSSTAAYVNGNPSSGKAVSDVGWKNAGNYYQFSVTPSAGYRLDLSSLTFDDKEGGPNAWSASYRLGSTGSFTTAATGSTHGSFTGNTVNAISGVNSTSATFLRLAATGAPNDNNKTWAIDNVVLNGNVTALAKMSASVAAPPSQVLVGTATSFNLSVSNTATGGTQQEGLNYSASATGDISGSETVTALTPAGSPHTTAFSVNTVTAGAKSGTVVAGTTNAYSINGNVAQASFSQNISVDVLDHSNASFASDSDMNTLNLDFGTVWQNSAQSLSFNIANLVNTAGFTAGLDLSSFNLAGSNPGQFSSDLTTFAALGAGGTNGYQVTLDTSTLGTYSASYTLNLGDDHTLSGAASGQTLTLTLNGTVVATPEPGTGLVLLAAGAFGLLRRRRNPSV